MRHKPLILIVSMAGLFCGLVLLTIWYYRPEGFAVCSQDFDLILVGGEVIDGLGHAPVKADIGIKDQRIACIGKLDTRRSKQIINADQLTIAPGFIDVHTHVERNVPASAPFLALNFLRQGVTTVITGNCGRSFADIGKSFKLLEANHSDINVASLIGHNTVRQQVMRQSAGPPTQSQLSQMKLLVSNAMSDGALGLSTGLVYIPGTFAKTDEIAALAQVVADNHGLYASHIRDEAAKGEEAISEAISIGERTGAHVHISHFKAQGPNQWGTAQRRLNLVRTAVEKGIVVSLDQYPYTASSTGLAVLMPSWLSEGDLSSARQRLSNPETRSRVRDEMLSQLRANGWADYSFARVAYYQFDNSLIGLNIAEITQQRANLHGGEPVAFTRSRFGASTEIHQRYKETELERQADTVMDLFAHGGAQMIFFDMNEQDVQTIMKTPDVMFGSDSSVREDGASALPHPRGLGTFPRVLGRYARDQGLFPVEEAVRRMTSLPATTFGLQDRGQIREGYWADLVVFDRNQIVDMATYEHPLSGPQGIEYVLVNGALVFDRGFFTKSLPGKVIRR